MNELAEQRRKNPTDDLTSALVHNDVGEDMLAPEEIAPFFILLAVAGNDTTRTAISLGMHLLSQNPDQRADLAGRPRGRGARPRSRRSCACASPVTFMRRTATEPVTPVGTTTSRRATSSSSSTAPPTATREVFDDPERFDVRRDPNPHVGFGGPGPHFCLGAHLARREVGVVFRQLLSRLPDIELAGRPGSPRRRSASRSSAVSSAYPVRFTPAKRSTA